MLIHVDSFSQASHDERRERERLSCLELVLVYFLTDFGDVKLYQSMDGVLLASHAPAFDHGEAHPGKG
jgi:hypothetical protein